MLRLVEDAFARRCIERRDEAAAKEILLAWITGWPDVVGWKFRAEPAFGSDRCYAVHTSGLFGDQILSSADTFSGLELESAVIGFIDYIATSAKSRYESFIETGVTLIQQEETA